MYGVETDFVFRLYLPRCPTIPGLGEGTSQDMSFPDVQRMDIRARRFEPARAGWCKPVCTASCGFCATAGAANASSDSGSRDLTSKESPGSSINPSAEVQASSSPPPRLQPQPERGQVRIGKQVRRLRKAVTTKQFDMEAVTAPRIDSAPGGCRSRGRDAPARKSERWGRAANRWN